MIDLETVQKYWLQWLLTGAGAVATAAILFCWKKIKASLSKFFSRVARIVSEIKAEDKAEYLKEIYDKIDQDKKDTDQKFVEVNNKLEEFKEKSTNADEAHQKQMEQIMQGIQALQQGVLSSHFNMLLNKSMTYIKRGWVSVEELELYEEELIVYRNLHGNGHLDPWIAKVRRLPNQKPSEK